MKRALISDFGGVLTSPLIEGFLAYQEQSGVTPAELGEAMAKAADEHGEHPLFELERGHISEAEFARRLEAELDGREFLCGDALSVADVTAASLLYGVALPPEGPWTVTVNSCGSASSRMTPSTRADSVTL